MLLYAVSAALCFAAGGLLMKMSAGVTRPAPTAGFLGLFVIGAVLQALAMRESDMGVVYLAVLGLEAVLALLFSTLLLRESLSGARVLGVVLVIVGIAILRRF